MKAELVPITDLTPDPANVRTHSSRNLEAVKASLLKFGQQKPIVINGAGVVIAGNATMQAAQALGWESIAVVRSELTGTEAIAYAIADNRTAELAEWGDDLGSVLQGMRDDPVVDHLSTGFTDEDVDDLLKSPEATPYTVKVESPIYTPTGECPEISELVDMQRANEIKAKIEKALEDGSITQEMSDFLQTAAARHHRFNYGRIAEFYAHATKEAQDLFQDSALVIIDIRQAIEGGFVKMYKEFMELAIDDSE